MNEAIMSGVTMEEPKPTNDDIIEMGGDLLGIVALAHDLPADFDGCTVSVLREPGTSRLTAVILSPVDMHGDEPFARYAVDPHHIAAPKQPKILLPS